MPVSPARNAAYRILRRLESGRAFAVDLFESPEVATLREVDRRLARELVMGVLRWGQALDFEVERLSGKPLDYFDPEVLTILRLGVYQIRFLRKIPKSAVVNEAVGLSRTARKRSAAGLINAVLRKCQPQTPPAGEGKPREPDAEMLDLARRSLPEWLFERWTRCFGVEAAKSLAWQSTRTPPTTLRVREPASDRDAIARELREDGIETRPGTHSRLALVVESGNVQTSRAFREGRVVIQDEASQLVAELVQAESGSSVLDLCAAPGIKTGQLADALGGGRLVACDLSARRLQTMAKLLAGRIPAKVRLERVRLDAARELPFRPELDRVLLDVPCSGTGTLARNPEIKWRLRPEDLPRLARVQEKMLGQALEVLRPGGRLVYATCSLEAEENELVAERILGEKPGYSLRGREELSRQFPSLSSFFDSSGYFHTRPDLHSMDGFFAAVIVRAG